MAVEFAAAEAGGKGDDAPARTDREEEGGEGGTTRARPSTTTTESSRDGRGRRRPGELGAAARPRPQAPAAESPAASQL